MATTYGAPTGLDLSACSVTATGGTTSQTLADLSKAVGDNATAVATAQSAATAAQTDASDAKTTAANAVSTATEVQTSINNLGSTYIPQTSINAASGVLGIASDNSVTLPVNSATGSSYLNFGSSTNPISTGQSAIPVYNISLSTGVKQYLDYLNCTNPDGSSNFGRYLDGTVLTGRSSGSLNIGVAAQPVNTVYAQNATVVTSDATAKTIAGRLTDTAYADGQKLIAALATVKPTVYQLNASIAEKGAAKARYHVGYIAQDVEAAITAAGLDPSKFALWTKTALFTVTENTDGTIKQTETVDTSGNQQYIQMLRYEEIFPVILAGLSAQVSELVTRVTALESAAKTTTGGAA